MTKLMNNFFKLNTLAAKRDSSLTRWCSVNTENEFQFEHNCFKMNDSVEQYAVQNKAVKVGSKWNDWTNESLMDKILVLALNDGSFEFYDENIEEIPSHNIKLLKGVQGNE